VAGFCDAIIAFERIFQDKQYILLSYEEMVHGVPGALQKSYGISR
jgi:hypothetical protein